MLGGLVEQAGAALGPERGDNAGRAGTPVVTGEDGTRDVKRVQQRHDVGAERGLLTASPGGRVEEAGRSVPAKVGDDDAEAVGDERWRDVDVAVDVIGKPCRRSTTSPSDGPASW